MSDPSYSSELLSVCLADGADPKRAQAFANRYQLPLIQGEDLSALSSRYVLHFTEHDVRIVTLGKGAPGPVSASFIGGKTEHRRKFGGGKGQLIAKAVGVKSGIYPHVLDATAGLARDAFVLASLGCTMTLVERSPVVAELLCHALAQGQRSEIQPICSRMSLLNENANDWLNRQEGTVADVIYLDPMYPHRDKSSLVKKEMRVFHDLVGMDGDSDALLESALSKARYRVVVKRPRKGDALNGPKPNHQLAGKSTRYDIYTLKSLEELRP